MRITSLPRKLMVGGLAVATLAGSLAATAAPASAAPRGHFAGVGHARNFGGFRHHGYYRGGRWIAPAVVGGLALGAFGAPYLYGERCWLEPRRVVNRFGHVVLRDVQVCG